MERGVRRESMGGAGWGGGGGGDGDCHHDLLLRRTVGCCLGGRMAMKSESESEEVSDLRPGGARADVSMSARFEQSWYH